MFFDTEKTAKICDKKIPSGKKMALLFVWEKKSGGFLGGIETLKVQEFF